MSTFCSERSFSNHVSFRSTLRTNFQKYLISVLLSITLVACGDSAPVDPNIKTQDDEDNIALQVTDASWDAEQETLTVSGLYNEDFPGASNDEVVTITIKDAVQADIIFASRKFDSGISDWEIEIENPMPPPCRITAEIEAEDDSEGFSANFIVEPPPQDCGDTPVTQAPIAAMMPSTDMTITAGSSITFMDNGSLDLNNNAALIYDWQFPGGSPANSTMQNPGNVIYNAPGSYVASLQVTDTAGMPSTLVSITVTVEAVNSVPVAAMMPSTDMTITVGNSVIFMDNGSSDPNNNATLIYDWQFPGGSPVNSIMQNPGAVLYSTPGSYIASLQVTDTTGVRSALVSITVTVGAVNQAPVAAMMPSTDMTITAGNSVTFMDNGSSDPDSNVALIYDWQFPGGNPASSASQNPGAIIYSTAGTYVASLQVTDTAGAPSPLVSINILVTDVTPVNQPPNGNIQSIPMVGANNTINITVGSTIDYSGIATDPDGDAMTYDWVIAGGGPLMTSTLLSPGIVTYAMVGTYTTTFTVTDSAMIVDPTPASLTVVVANSPPPTGGTMVSLIVLNDLHAHLTLHDDLKRNANGSMVAVKRGGLARIVTEINMIRNNNANSVLMNIGDTFHGGVEAFFSLGNDIVAPVNALGIDIGVPGNWDFAYGPNVTRARYTNGNSPAPTPINIAQTTFPNLAANVTNSGPFFPAGTLLPATFTKTVAGVKIGFIGITSDMVPFMSPLLATGMTFLQGETNYVNLINGLVIELNNQVPAPDIVVVMSELGIHKDQRLADLITPNSVDVFFSAHTHELTTTPLQSTSGALVVEAGNDTYLGRMDVTVLANTPNSFLWRVIPIEATIVEDVAMKALIDSARAAYINPGVNLTYPGPISSQSLTMPITTPLTTTSYLLSRRSSLESSFNNLMTDLVMNPTVGTVTDIAVTAGFRFDSVIPGMGDVYEDQTVASGQITVEDIYRFFPAPYILATANISEPALRQNIEANLTRVYSTDIFQQVGGWADGYAGLIINLNLANPDGSRVISLINKSTGMTILPTDNLTITGCTRPFEVNSGSFCTNGTGFTNITPLTNSTGGPLTAVDYIIGALNNNENANFPARTDVSDSNNSPMWPVSEFIQPIRGLP